MKTDTVIVAGDIGGTNTTIALMAPEGDSFRIVQKKRYSSQKLSGIEEAVQDSLEDFRSSHPQLAIQSCCFSAAGPVRNNICKLTNVAWSVDGSTISSHFDAPVFVINDFSAVCYGLPLLNLNDPDEVCPLPHPDGSMPSPHGDVMAAVGAGTGLGVGFLIRSSKGFHAFPSEGGHSDLSPVDETMISFYRFLQEELGGQRPGAELSVSGMGIGNLYRYFRSLGEGNGDPVIEAIDSITPLERPAHISKAAEENHVLAKKVIQYFVKMYANFASNAAATLIPGAGLFLAGGIASKNEQFFTGDQLFMKTFLQNYNPNIQKVIAGIPVYIVKNYDVSLYGAANAARILGGSND
ncbi:glucokinase [Spirochaeta dissipatitropha]